MTKINFTEYATKEDFLKDFPIINGYLSLSRRQINDNDLIHILKLIGVEPSLEWLDLCYNQLTYLPADIFNGLSNLKRLDLYNNQLKTLPMSIKKSLPNDCKIHTDNDFKWVEDVIENKSGEQITQIQMIIEKNNLKIQKFQDENNVLQRALKILIDTENN